MHKICFTISLFHASTCFEHHVLETCTGMKYKIVKDARYMYRNNSCHACWIACLAECWRNQTDLRGPNRDVFQRTVPEFVWRDTLYQCETPTVETSWNVKAHAQKPDFVFRRNGRVHLNRPRRHQFSRLLAAEVCASAVVMLDTPCSEVVWRVLATHSIRQFHLHFPSRASPCTSTFQLSLPAEYIGSRHRLANPSPWLVWVTWYPSLAPSHSHSNGHKNDSRGMAPSDREISNKNAAVVVTV